MPFAIVRFEYLDKNNIDMIYFRYESGHLFGFPGDLAYATIFPTMAEALDAIDDCSDNYINPEGFFVQRVPDSEN